jgi:dTDP-4-dehydrorhamnose 3,5-epimerase
MNLVPIPQIEGAYTAVLEPHKDARGTLVEIWNVGQISKDSEWSTFIPVQINFVTTNLGAIRGIHRTIKSVAQRKVVTCIAGKVLDVLVDLRPESATFRRIAEIELSTGDLKLVFIPERVGHSFQGLEQENSVCYFFDHPYQPSIEIGINPLDDSLGINWQTPYILSNKDSALPKLDSVLFDDL